MKKQFIQKLSIAMAAALTVTSVAQAPVSAATKAMKMDRDSKILYLNEDNSSKTGKSYDFSIKNKGKNYKKLYTFSWYADDDAIVSVKKGGVVTAKKVGKTKVYCTIKNKKGKTVANPKATVTVKANAATVDITNLPENLEMAPGAQNDFNRTMKNFKGGKATDKTEWIVSANEEGTEATDVATVDSKGVVTTAKAGEFYLTARCYQSKDYKEKTTASKTIKITVKASITEATNSAYNEVKLTFNDDMSKVLTDKNIKITNATGITQVVKAVAFEENGKVAKVTVYNPLANDVVYTVKAGELDAVDFTAKVGEAAILEIVSPNQAVFYKPTEVKCVLKDANGVILNSDNTKLTFEYDVATSSCYFEDYNKIVCYELDKVNTVTAVYATGKYEAGTGAEIKIKSQPFAITCVKETAPAVVGAPVFTISETENAGADQFKNIVSVVAKDKRNKYINVKYVLDDKSDVLYSAADDKWTFESTDEKILIVDANTGLLLPIKEGSVSVICKYNNAIVNTFAITVGADAKSSNIDLDKKILKLSNASSIAASEVVTCTLKDQYGAEFQADGLNNDGKVGSAVSVKEDTSTAEKTSKPEIVTYEKDPSLKANQFKVVINGCKEGTYKYNVTRDNRTIPFTVEVQKPNNTNAYVTVNADKSKVDTKVTNGMNLADKAINVKLVVMANNGVATDIVTGGSVKYIVKNANTNEVVTDSALVTEADGSLTIKTVRESTDGKSYEKLPVGTYVVSATYGGKDYYTDSNGKNIKIVDSRFVVEDTQDTTVVKTKSVKITLSGNTLVSDLYNNPDLKACFELANNLNGNRDFSITKITTTVDNTKDKTLIAGNTYKIVVNQVTTEEVIDNHKVHKVYTIDVPVTVEVK